MAKDEKTYSQSELDSAIKGVARAMAEEMLPAFAAAMKSNPQPAQVQAQAVPGPTNYSGLKCEVCGQLEKACGGVEQVKPNDDGVITPSMTEAAYSKNHVKMVVFPERYPEFAAWFRGCGINGVWYLSNNSSHRVWVPKASVGDIQRMIFEHEKNERETHMGKSRVHNSGSIENPQRAQPTNGWR